MKNYSNYSNCTNYSKQKPSPKSESLEIGYWGFPAYRQAGLG